MTTLTTTATLPDYGDDEIALRVEYTYSRRFREIYIDACTIEIAGRHVDVWHKLSQMQRWLIEERCRNDADDAHDAAREAKYAS